MTETHLNLSDGESKLEASTPRKMKSYTNEFKLKVIKHAETVSNKNAAEKFGITRSRVIEWRKQKDELKRQRYLIILLVHGSYYVFCSESSPIGRSKKRLAGGGRKLSFADLDNQLAQWVRQHRLMKHRISRRIIQKQGERMFNAELDEGQFKVLFNSHDIFTMYFRQA